MIRIKVLKLEKWVYAALFIIGIVLLIMIFKNIAYEYSTVEVFSTEPSENISNDNKFENDVLKNILGRAFPVMSISVADEREDNSFVLGMVKFFTRINYRDPKTLIMAEFPIMGNYNIPVSRGGEEGWDKLHDGIPYDPENDIEEILQQYDFSNIKIYGEGNDTTTLNPDIGKPDKTRMDMKKPLVLIYHTHTSEAYKPSRKYNYTPTDVDRTIDPRYSVVRIGKELKEVLEKQYSIKVIHNTTFHDYPNYGSSYARSIKTVGNMLATYPSVKVLLDIHRDAFPMRNKNEIASARAESVINVDGNDISKVMLVWGPDADNSKETRKFAELLKNNINRQVPGLCRKVLEKSSGRYNQQLSNYATLIEVGSNTNTLEEALKTVPYLAKAISQTIEEIEE